MIKDAFSFNKSETFQIYILSFFGNHSPYLKVLVNKKSSARLGLGGRKQTTCITLTNSKITINNWYPFGLCHIFHVLYGYWNHILRLNNLKEAEHVKFGNASYKKTMCQ